MSGLGWAVGVGVALLAVAAVSSNSKQTSVAQKGDVTSRFTIKHNVIDPSLALPLSAFAKGDILSVTLHDSKSNVDITPFLVTVDKVAKDGIDAVYTGISTVLGLDPGTHFAVFPRDVLARVPSTTPSDAPLEHVLDAGDVAMGPAAFAVLAGFTGADAVIDFELYNKGIFEDTPALITDAGQPGIYVSGAVPFLTYRRVTPWTVGTKVLVKKQPLATVVPPGVVTFAGEFGGQFGRRKASVGFGV